MSPLDRADDTPPGVPAQAATPTAPSAGAPAATGPSAPGDLSILKLSIPVAMGYIPLGMAFGFLLAQAGGAWWLAPLMSLFIYAGAAQFMVVPMLASGQTLAAIAVATLVVNLRHIFYGLSVLDRLPDSRWARTYLAWALTDESYSLITTLPPQARPRHVIGVAMLNHGWWILGSTLGALIGSNLSPSLQGFDFSLAALFAILVQAQWRSHRQLAPLLTAVISYALAWLLMPSQALLLAIALSVLVCIVLANRRPDITAPAMNSATKVPTFHDRTTASTGTSAASAPRYSPAASTPSAGPAASPAGQAPAGNDQETR